MKKKLFIIIPSLVFLVGVATLVWRHYGNCSGDCHYDAKMSWVCEMNCAAKNYDKNKVVANSKAKPGDLTKCPVSGVVFTIVEGSGTIRHNDITYHTCCGTCANMYAEDSVKYATNFN